LSVRAGRQVEKADVLFLGPPGVGKSFLVQGIGMQANGALVASLQLASNSFLA